MMRMFAAVLVLLCGAMQLRTQSPQDSLGLTLHHATASVADLDRAIKWYEEKLGFKLQMRRKLNQDAEIAWMIMPGNRIDLIQRKGSMKPPAVKDHMLVQGWGHIVFAVPDADRAYAILKARGANLPEPVSVNSELHIKTSHFPDSEGNWLEIYQDLSASKNK
jgi:catechol 2,3-dioxygenase-like lactoylglutathione lyase family enzyme